MLHNKLSKVNIIKIITIILLMLTSVTLLQKAYTIQTYADPDITEEDDDNYNDEEKKSSGGVHSSKTGFVCYISTEEGALKSPVVACFPTQKPSGTGVLNSRVGNSAPSMILTNVPWVPKSPWGDGGTANGGKIKQWFLEDDGAELRFFVEQELGVDYNTAVAEGWWLVIEQVSWCT